MHGVGMRIDGKRGKIGVLPAVLEHITPHHHGIQADERDTHIHFVIGIRGRGERSRHLMRMAVGHFFDANRDGRFQLPRSDRHQGRPESRRSRSAGGLHLDGIPAAQAGPIDHQRTEIGLAVDDARHHVANKNALGRLASSIVHGVDDGIRGDVANRFFPLFVNDGLSDAEDCDRVHKKNLS